MSGPRGEIQAPLSFSRVWDEFTHYISLSLSLSLSFSLFGGTEWEEEGEMKAVRERERNFVNKPF